MATINRVKGTLSLKIVFYGPGLCGKTTTLQHIHAATKPERRGNIVSLATDAERTLYFDYVPIKLLKIGAMTVVLQLFTVPGQVYYAAIRKLVLNGVDGVVFVADSQSTRLESNLESLHDLNANLADHGRKLSTVPHTFHWNKRDLDGLSSIGELERRLNLFSAPSTQTIATSGEGVFAGLEKVTRLVVEAFRAELPAAHSKSNGGGIPLYLDAEGINLAGAIKDLAEAQPARPRTPAQPAPGSADVLAAKQAAATASPAVPVEVPREARETTPAPSVTSALSFATLWPLADADAARRAETLLAAHDLAGAVLACDDLLTRVLTASSLLQGAPSQSRDLPVIVTLLGLDGKRYLATRAAAQAARNGRHLTMRAALECYAFAIEARLALSRAQGFHMSAPAA